MEYFIIQDGQQIGPLSIDQVFNYSITPETQIWYEGLPGWIQLNQDSVLFKEYQNRYQEPPKYPGFNNSGSFNNGGFSTNYAEPMRPRPPKPSNYLACSIITTILCCLVTGIIAIIYSTKVDSAYAENKFEEARSFSKTAYWLNMGSLIVMGLFYIIYLVCIFIGVFASATGLAALDSL